MTALFRVGAIAAFSALFTSIAVLPADAFNCAKASTDVEQTLCSNPALKAGDDEMAAAYHTLRRQLGTPGRQALLNSQRAWLAFRNRSCGPVASCLRSVNEEQTTFLTDTPSGMAPLFMWRAGRPNRYEIKVQGYLFTDARAPGERGFNDAVSGLVRKVPFDEKIDEGEHADGRGFHHLFFRLYRQDRQMLSAMASTSVYSGGAHPNSTTRGITIDRETGRALQAGDLFDRAGRERLGTDCALQIIEGKSRAYGQYDQARALEMLEDEYPGAIDKHIADIKRWHFTRDGGVVRFDAYAIGGYAEGPFECSFSTRLLNAQSTIPSYFTGGG